MATSAARKNIVFFGETGSGKSSIINMLLGRDEAAVSDKAIGCTFEFSCYETDRYCFYDTAGLSEGSHGTVTANSAIGNLVKLLKHLKNGVNLLVFVMEKGKIKKTLEENYKLFVKNICMDEVPVIGVITHCEQETIMGTWWAENKSNFDQYGMEFCCTVPACATKGENMLPVFAETLRTRYAETKVNILRAIEQHALREAWKLENWKQWLGLILKKVFNTIAKWFQWPQMCLWPALKELFLSQGHDDASATALSNNLYETITSE